MGILTSTKRTQPTGGPRSAYDDDFAGPATLARRMRLLLPTDQRKVYWDWLVVVIVLWNVFMIPFSFGFGLVWQAGAGLEAVDEKWICVTWMWKDARAEGVEERLPQLSSERI